MELFSEIDQELPNPLPIEIDEDLDCIVCYESMGLNGASIYQCTEGRLLCPNCYDPVRICPVCRKPYERPPIRNRLLKILPSSTSAKLNKIMNKIEKSTLISRLQSGNGFPSLFYFLPF